MKHLFILLTLASLPILSQPEPEQLNVFYALANGIRGTLEHQTIKGSELVRGVFGNKASWVVYIPGRKSQARYQSDTSFLVRSAGDPTVWTLRQLVLSKEKKDNSGRRELLVLSAQASLLGKIKSDSTGRTVQLTWTQAGPSIYKASTVEPLQAGEYAFYLKDNQSLYCFGVD